MLSSKKISSFVFVASLFVTSFITCEEDFHKNGIFEKYRKNIIITGGLVLGAYSAKQIAHSLVNAVNWMMFYKRSDEFFEESNVAKGLLATAHLFNIARISFHGFLMYFSLKNIIKELRGKGKHDLPCSQKVQQE